MSQKKLPKINRIAAPHPASSQCDYAFVFSDNILDWQRSRKREVNRQNYEIEKERNHIKRLQAILEQEPRKLGA